MLGLLTRLLPALFLVSLAHAADPAASPINLAGEERMLSQRIVKAYAQIGLEVTPTTAKRQKIEATARFEANLEALKPAVAGSREASRAHERLREVWTPFRAAAAAPVTRDSALALSRQSLEVLAAADRLTQTLEDAAPPGPGQLVNMAGRQRMLSQRLAKAYLLRSWGVGGAAVGEEMDAVANEFAGRLTALLAQPENTPDIRRELEEIAQQWEWLQTALAAEGAISYRLIVAEAADSILEASDRVTRLYEQLGSR